MLITFLFFSKKHCMTAAAFLQSHRAPQHSWQTPQFRQWFLGSTLRSYMSSGNFYWDCQGTPGNPLRNTRVPASARKGHLWEAVTTQMLSQQEEVRSLQSIGVIRERMAASSLKSAVSWAPTPAALRERSAAPLLLGLGNGDYHNGS